MKKYKNVYFDDINYQNSCTEQLYYQMKKDRRNHSWRKERTKCGGWDERCTWSLDMFMAEQIYTWLKLYMDASNVNLDFYHFEITFPTEQITETKSQKEWIEDVISCLEAYITLRFSIDKDSDVKANKSIKRAFIILGEIAPVLWG